MDKINEIIIIGGGNSIKKAFSFNATALLQDKCVIACNYSFRHFSHTILTFADADFYVPLLAKSKKENNPDITEELKKEPLIIGVYHNKTKGYLLPNTFLFKHNSILKKMNSPDEGFYTKSFLTGIFSLSLACFLLDYSGVIYLLGFDWSKEGESHYYSKEEINHRGQGYLNHYRSHKPESVFDCYNQFTNLKIYNVSPESNIPSFEKINFENMFKLMNNEKYNKEELRELIRRKLCIK